MGEHLLLWFMYHNILNIIFITNDYMGYQSKHKNHHHILQ